MTSTDRGYSASFTDSVPAPQLLTQFILGLYIVAFGAVIALLGKCNSSNVGSSLLRITATFQGTSNPEFRVPPEAQTYASFLFSFIGRGVCKYR